MGIFKNIQFLEMEKILMLNIERQNKILLITLNRPEKRNSLHPDLIKELSKYLTQAATDQSLNVILITGSGTSFCAGLDLKHLLSLDSEGKTAYMRSLFALFHQIYTQPQPVLAAINGPAMAGGFDLAAFCDLRICSPNAIFAQTEILIGLTQIFYPLYKSIGLGRAKELAMIGEPISAQEAYRIGLVNQIYPQEELLAQSLNWAEKMANRPTQALFETKRLCRDLIEMDTKSAMERMFQAISERLASAEHQQETEKYFASLKQGK